MKNWTSLPWRASAAPSTPLKTGVFRDEIVPVEVPGRKGPTIFETDQQPRADTTAEALAKLRPAFKKDGMVTAGNSSGLNDGAAAVVVMSRRKAEQLGLKPMATIRSYASAGVEPRIMGMGPVPSTRLALGKGGSVKLSDIDLIEANEAFAAQSVAVGKELGFDRTKLNVNGGAIALGHPIGASGTRILVTLLYEMQPPPIPLRPGNPLYRRRPGRRADRRTVKIKIFNRDDDCVRNHHPC